MPNKARHILLKVVIDTNVFISGILTEGGKPSIVIKAWRRTFKYQLFTTEEIIKEIIGVMKKLNLPSDIIAEWENILQKYTINIIPTKKIDEIKDDPADNKFLECAVESSADYIISGDKHLRRLESFEGIKIVNAKEFLDILSSLKE